MSKPFSARELAEIALGAALICVCSWLTIPGAIPFTLQSFAICLLAALLGLRGSLGALGLYLLLGAVGLPVFSGFRNGLGVLLGPTGGYLIGFVFTVLAVGFAAERPSCRPLTLALGMLAGMLLCYACGTAWFVVVYMRSGKAISVLGALGLCVFPFLLPDAAKCALAVVLARRLRPILHRR